MPACYIGYWNTFHAFWAIYISCTPGFALPLVHVISLLRSKLIQNATMNKLQLLSMACTKVRALAASLVRTCDLAFILASETLHGLFFGLGRVQCFGSFSVRPRCPWLKDEIAKHCQGCPSSCGDAFYRTKIMGFCPLVGLPFFSYT